MKRFFDFFDTTVGLSIDCSLLEAEEEFTSSTMPGSCFIFCRLLFFADVFRLRLGFGAVSPFGLDG